MSALCARVARNNEGVVKKASPVQDANSNAKVIEEGLKSVRSDPLQIRD